MTSKSNDSLEEVGFTIAVFGSGSVWIFELQLLAGLAQPWIIASRLNNRCLTQDLTEGYSHLIALNFQLRIAGNCLIYDLGNGRNWIPMLSVDDL